MLLFLPQVTVLSCRRNIDVDACMRGLRVALENAACIIVGHLFTTVNTISNNSTFVIWFYCVHVH